MNTVSIGNKSYKFETEQEVVKLNDSVFTLDWVKINEKQFHAIKDHKSYNIELIDIKKLTKQAIIKVNSTVYHVSLKDQFDELLKSMGLENLGSIAVKDIKAPMPGLVLKVLVNNNDEVKKGDSLMVLEAMKMENLIKSPADVKIKEIKIIPGGKVEKNQILILFH